MKAAVTLLLVCACLAARATEVPRLTLGVLSDLHIRTQAGAADFAGALAFFDRRKVDGVIVCGDLTDEGTHAELEIVRATWRKAFPAGRRSDGEPVAELFLYGDHDTSKNRALYTYEKERRIETRRLKGYDIVMGHFDGDWGSDVPPLAKTLEALKPDPAKPFFYVQHRVMRGTVGGPHLWGQDVGHVTKTLARYPNAVALCGHCHLTATDEKSVWQDAFTALEVPSMSYLETPPGRENGCSINDGRPSFTWEKVSFDPPRLMPPDLRADRDDAQGYLMTVYDNRLVVERYDMKTFVRIGPDWKLPFPIPAEKPYAHATRAAHDPAPAFAPGASVGVCETAGVYRVTFPVAASTSKTPRAFDYEVTAVLTKGDVTRVARQKRVFSRKMHLDEARDTGPVTCLFARAEIPDFDTLAFEIRPVNCFGRAGAAIVSKPRVRLQQNGKPIRLPDGW